MGLPATKLNLSEFLDWENQQTERHEFYQGGIFAMVGVRRVHGLVSGNIAIALSRYAKGTPYQVFSNSLQLRINQNIYYPDVFVTCDKAACILSSIDCTLATDKIFEGLAVADVDVNVDTSNYLNS